MTNIQRHIQYLVATSDCVIIPGWGGLIACYTPAHVDGSRFMPPSRSVVFNPSLTHDDGMLASSICRREGVSFETARDEIASEVASMRSTYDACGSLSLPRIGTFSRLPDSTMRFDADPSGIAGARYFALPPVIVADESANQSTATATEVSAPNLLQRESIGKRVLRIAAFVAILLGLARTLSTPMSVNFNRKADFAAVGASPAQHQQHAMEKPVNVQLVLCIPDSTISIVPTSSRPTVQTQLEEPHYYLVIGSLDSKKQAERWMSRRTDTAIGIVERNGRYRVYAATGSTLNEAFQLKNDPDFSRRYPDAWVYCRR